MSLNFQKTTNTVTEEFDNCLLWKYIKIFRKDWTKLFIIKQLRNKEILVNKQSAAFNSKLKINDTVTYIASPPRKQFKELNIQKLKPLKVIYEDKEIIVAYKEPNISVQSNAKSLLQNMNNKLLNHFNIKISDPVWKPAFIHRLDHNTCGILIGAKTLTMLQKLSLDLKERKINKWYKVLVVGKFKHQKMTLKNWLYKKNNLVLVSEEERKGSKEAISIIELIKVNKNTSLLSVQIITGRKHQIRVQLSHLGFPVCGDFKYGTRGTISKKYPYSALCAYRVEFLSDDPKLDEIKKQNIEVEDVWFENPKYLI